MATSNAVVPSNNAAAAAAAVIIEDMIPPHVFPKITSFLSINDTMKLIDASDWLLNNVGAAFHEIEIRTVDDMNLAAFERFPNVRAIKFVGVNEKPGFLSRFVPFLATFPALEKVDISTYFLQAFLAMVLAIPDARGEEYDPYSRIYYMEGAIKLLCDAYASGQLSNNVEIEGPFCPYAGSCTETDTCILCRQVMRTFPIQHILRADENDQVHFNFHNMATYWANDRFDAPVPRPWPIQDARAGKAFIERPGGRDAFRALYHAMQHRDEGDVVGAAPDEQKEDN